MFATSNSQNKTRNVTSFFIMTMQVCTLPFKLSDFLSKKKLIRWTIVLVIKNKIHGYRFCSPEEALEAFKSHISDISIFEWHICIQHWFIRLKSVTDAKGEYFEKEWNTLFQYESLFRLFFKNLNTGLEGGIFLKKIIIL